MSKIVRNQPNTFHNPAVNKMFFIKIHDDMDLGKQNTLKCHFGHLLIIWIPVPLNQNSLSWDLRTHILRKCPQEFWHGGRGSGWHKPHVGTHNYLWRLGRGRLLMARKSECQRCLVAWSRSHSEFRVWPAFLGEEQERLGWRSSSLAPGASRARARHRP